MKKRIVSALMAGMMIAATTVGCGSGESDSSDNETSAESSQSEDDEIYVAVDCSSKYRQVYASFGGCKSGIGIQSGLRYVYGGDYYFYNSDGDCILLVPESICGGNSWIDKVKT